MLSPHSSFHFQGQGLSTATNTTFSSLSFGLGGECGLGQIQSPRAWPQSSLGQPGPGRLASSSRRSPPPCRPILIPRSASCRTAGSGIRPISGPDKRLRLALRPAHSAAPGHGRGGQAAEEKEAAAGVAEPEAAAFVGRSCVLRARGVGGGGGKKDTARSGSREPGEARPGRRSGSRWAARVQEARDPPPTPSPRHGLRKRRGHSHGCAGLQGPRAVGTLGVAGPARAAAAAVAAAGASPSLRSAAPPRWAPPPALPSGSRTRKGRPQLAPPSQVTRQSGLPTVSTSLWEGRPKGDRRCLREPGSFLGTAHRP